MIKYPYGLIEHILLHRQILNLRLMPALSKEFITHADIQLVDGLWYDVHAIHNIEEVEQWSNSIFLLHLLQSHPET